MVDWVEGKEKEEGLHGKLWSILTYLVLGGLRVKVQFTGQPGDSSTPTASGKRGKEKGQEARDEGECSKNEEEEEAQEERRKEKQNMSRVARKGWV